MSRVSFYCPFCFEHIKRNDILFHCHQCGSDLNIHGEKVSADGGILDKDGKIVKYKREKSFLENLGLMSPPRRMKCHCGHNAMGRKCPVPTCRSDLPTAIDELSDLFIAVIGAKEAGKSHYIALLIYRIKQLHSDFGWTLTELGDSTRDRYRNDFYTPLFERHQTLQTTRSATIQKEISHPLLYSLRFSKGNQQRQIMLAFFDTAGEDLNKDVKTMSIVNKYIVNASGIICLLDPLQFYKVRASVEGRVGKGALPEQGKDTAVIISQIAELIRNGHLAQGKSKTATAQIKIPLAIAFSKIDAVGDNDNSDTVLLPQQCPVFRDTRHRGILHQSEFTTIHQLMEGWLTEVDPQRDILNQSKAFDKVAYFGLSALGFNPKLTNGKLDGDPRPMRVEDPFLWILQQNGLIK